MNDQATPADLEVILRNLGAPGQPVWARLVSPGILVAGHASSAELGLPIAGRLPTAQLSLPRDKQVSRKHFLIELAPTVCRLTNLSDHGTFVNNMLVFADSDLRHGDLVRVGGSSLSVEVRERGDPVDLPASATVLWAPKGDTTLPTTEELPLPPPVAVLQIPGYRLLRPLGSGGMGTVWLAETMAGEQVACKVIRPDLALDTDTCSRFRRETLLLQDLRHPHIVGFRDSGVASGGLLYLVLDYVPGRSLADVLWDEGPFAIGRAVRLTCQLLHALAHAHNSGVVHRDVKPSNVLVLNGPSGEEVRLADFGLAKAYQSADVAASVTLPGVMGGTMAFAAPEQLTDFRRAGPLADQYAAAATLYNLLTDCHLHDANGLQLLDCIRTSDPVSLAQRRRGLPDDLVKAVHRALQRDPKARFPTVKVFLEVLLPFAAA